MRRRTWLLFLLALVLRLVTVGWDAGVPSTSLHPDERQVGFVTERLEGWFSDPGFFAYGSLHFQAIRALAAVLPTDDGLRGLIVSGRLLSVFSSMLALLLGWLMARRAWGRRTADLFLLIAAWVPLDLQQSHFATVEAHHTAWIVVALAACFWLALSSRQAAAAAAGAAVGASLAVKVASLALGLPLAAALLIAPRTRGFLDLLRLGSTALATGLLAFWLCQPWAFDGGRPPLVLMAAAAAAAACLHVAARIDAGRHRALVGVGVVALAFALLQGAALLGVGGSGAIGRGLAAILIEGGINPAYAGGVGEQVRMVMGKADLPYVRVFVNTLPVAYPLRELALWGLGPALLAAAVAAAGFGFSILARRWRRLLAGRWSASAILVVITLAWLVPMSARLGTLYVKYLRYWEPLVVPAALIAAWWLSRLPARVRGPAVRVTAAATILWGAAYLWAFVEPHPHRTASRWLTSLVEPGQVVAFENWDETIAVRPERGAVEIASLPSYDLPDDDDKVLRWCRQLERADWVVLTSNRVLRTILANPQRFQRTRRLYQLLLTGEAGFEVLSRAARGPRILGLRWPVQLADESFVNYDFPQVVILRRTSRVTSEDLAEQVRRPLPFVGTMGLADFERHLARHTPAIAPVPNAGRQLIDTGLWLLVFVILTVATWVLLLPLFRGWPDAGLGLAAASGWFASSWLMWMGNELGLWPAGPAAASWIVIVLLSGGALAAAARWSELVASWRSKRRAIAAVVAVALVVGLLFLAVRACNPAIYWGEKPMDFAFLNAFVRAESWPPGEPWMAGMPLHYYYFGEVLASLPILATGCAAGVGYNLMAATVPALAAAGLAGLGLLMAGRRRALAALVLPALVLLTGNLAWPWLLELARGGKWFDLWWATSRVIPGFAIDEYPLWTALFADLHGHFLALPVLVATLAWGWLTVHLAGRHWLAAAAMTGIGTAALVATNPWDLFILTGTLGVGTVAAARRRWSGLLRLAVAAAVSVIAAGPFIVELAAGITAGAGERGLFLTEADFAPAWAVLRHFGLFLVPLAAAAFAALGRRSWIALTVAALGVIAGLSFRSPAAALALAAAAVFVTVCVFVRDRLPRLAWSLAGFGALGIAACERFTLIDRMNTLFKVYNGVWLLLAAALAALIFQLRGRQRAVLLAAWLPLQAAAVLNLPLGVAQGWLQPRIVSPRPTLDGQAFLQQQDRATWFLVRALQGSARPGETVAESAGPYYSRHTRIVMHTGLPTVVGWEWHLTQRGQPAAEIRARFADLETLYADRDPRARREVLDRYRVRWAVLSDLERETYGLGPDASLAGVPGVVEIARRDGAALYRVLPWSTRGRGTIAPVAELPPGVNLVGRLPEVHQPTLRSLHRDRQGALAVMSDGGVVLLDELVARTEQLPESGCDPRSAARTSGQVWLLCDDGRLYRYRGQRWQPFSNVPEADALASDESLWAFGRGGLWRIEGERARTVAPGPVTAAAVTGPWAAWSDGSRVWLGRADGEPQPVEPGLNGVTALAWQGPNLWAIDADGLHRSGGGMLPWRRHPLELSTGATLAGGSESLWIVRTDGVVVEIPKADCPTPWERPPPDSRTGLREPRGIAVSPSGWFVVADTLNHRVRWYGERGLCLDEVGGEGAEPGDFREPSGVALAAGGALAVADTWNGRIQILRRDGTTESAGAGLFGPRSVLWAPDGSLLVADTGNRRLLRMSPPGWEAATVIELPAPVVGLAWAGGLLAAATPADGAVVMVDLSRGEVVRRLEIPGWRGGEQQEGYLALLPSGEIAASAPGPGEIWIADPSGAKAARLLRSGLPGVTAIAVRPQGDLLAALTWEHRLVQVPLEE